ncbi:hypothetical protein KDA23_06185 [Candidatus Saccharibacteria bacterium]|nr:hypothetical protein [Candidatus Saccharibacteria bacterium]
MSAETAHGGASSLPRNLDGITNVVALYNPVSTHAEASTLLIDRLSRTVAHYDLTVSSYETSPDQVENDDMVRELAKPGETIVAIAGGDGTISGIGNALLRTKVDDPVLVLPCGNANDIAAQIYGSQDELYHPSTLVTGETRRVHPLALTVTPEGGSVPHIDRFAIAYAGIGAAGLTAHRVNQADFRASSMHGYAIGKWHWGTSVLEKAVAAQALVNSRYFVDTIQDEKLTELMFANGDRMAKDFQLDADLFKATQRLYRAAGNLSRLKLLVGLLRGSAHSEPLARHDYHLRFPTKTFLHIDGEDYPLHGYYKVSVRRADQSLQMLTSDTVH